MMMSGRLSNTVAETIDEKKEGIGARDRGVEDKQEEILQGTNADVRWKTKLVTYWDLVALHSSVIKKYSHLVIANAHAIVHPLCLLMVGQKR